MLAAAPLSPVLQGKSMSASQFEQACGRGDYKKWKQSLWVGGDGAASEVPLCTLGQWLKDRGLGNRELRDLQANAKAHMASCEKQQEGQEQGREEAQGEPMEEEQQQQPEGEVQKEQQKEQEEEVQREEQTGAAGDREMSCAEAVARTAASWHSVAEGSSSPVLSPPTGLRGTLHLVSVSHSAWTSSHVSTRCSGGDSCDR